MDGLQRDLVFDIGLHLGEDSAYYLRKGYRVVAFEANSDLVERAKQRFREPIEEGRFSIVSGAIANTDEPTITFYTHRTRSEWGTIEPDWAERNANIGVSIPVEVPVVNFQDVLQTYGMPWFMKIDIEGADILCLKVLRDYTVRPAFVSIESEKVDWPTLLEEFALLDELGFDRFAAVQQQGITGREIQSHTLSGEPFTYRFEDFSSGPFGDDISSWRSRDEVLAQYKKIYREYRIVGDRSLLRRTFVGRKALGVLSRITQLPLPGWYDTHAARSVDAVVRMNGGQSEVI
jgi:FkbM family methyltransferase